MKSYFAVVGLFQFSTFLYEQLFYTQLSTSLDQLQKRFLISIFLQIHMNSLKYGVAMY